jgi:hypothetical protein
MHICAEFVNSMQFRWQLLKFFRFTWVATIWEHFFRHLFRLLWRILNIRLLPIMPSMHLLYTSIDTRQENQALISPDVGLGFIHWGSMSRKLVQMLNLSGMGPWGLPSIIDIQHLPSLFNVLQHTPQGLVCPGVNYYSFLILNILHLPFQNLSSLNIQLTFPKHFFQ